MASVVLILFNDPHWSEWEPEHAEFQTQVKYLQI